jgi:hypothetical protein
LEVIDKAAHLDASTTAALASSSSVDSPHAGNIMFRSVLAVLESTTVLMAFLQL